MTEKDLSFYLEGTNGIGVLLVHGLTGAPAEMKFVGKHLNKLGFTVYAPVLAGHCQDKKSLMATNYQNWVGSLRVATVEFSKKVTEVHAAGICVGGGLALYLAMQEPKLIKSVVIYSPTLHYNGWNSPKLYHAISRFCLPILSKTPVVKGFGIGESHPFGFKSERIRNAIMKAGIAGTLPKFPLYSLNENYRLNRSLKKLLPNCKTPTLLIHAREDDVSHPSNADNIKKLHGGECKIVLLDDSYHMIHVDQERGKVATYSANFFESNSGKKHG